jgi:ATP-dependent RNA helicase DDX3X
MADGLKMNGLSLNDSQHAPSHPAGRSAYIPPHLRGQARGPPGPAPVGFDGSGPAPGVNAWGPGYVNIQDDI